MMAVNVSGRSVSIFSYNMRGFNCGHHTVRDYVLQEAPDIFLLQEHWLTPANLTKFDEHFPQYFCFGSSAMSSCVQEGVLRGRPFGGVMTLVSRKLKAEVVCAADRFVIVAIGNLLIVNVYMPCAGSNDRLVEYEDVLTNIAIWLDHYPHYNVIVGGDLNTDLDKCSPVAALMHNFMCDHGLNRCDTSNANSLCTYYNEALASESNIDFFIANNLCTVLSYETLDPYINLSDHRPIFIKITYKDSDIAPEVVDDKKRHSRTTKPHRYRWDHANLELYRLLTGTSLNAVYEEIKCAEGNKNSDFDAIDFIDYIYSKVTGILLESSQTAVPSCQKNFYKFWWDDSLDELKQKSIASCQIWRAAGRPRSGPISIQYRRDKAAYKHAIREKHKQETEVYTNELHEALLRKEGKTFWNCWASKFESSKTRITHVDGISDSSTIGRHFAQHFAKVCTSSSSTNAANLAEKYRQLRANYSCSTLYDSHIIDVETVESAIQNMKCGKAAGLDGITVEHLKFCHVVLPCILSRLFNLMLAYSHVPYSFGQSYTVPLLKNNCNAHSKTLTVDDFRGISISPVLSKVFEHCILEKFSWYFVTSDNQFGFKRHSGCTDAVYTLRLVTEYYVSYGSTINLCSIDLSKAFDKMNHHGLFLKLMQRQVPINLLKLLENWFSIGVTCVKWDNTFSNFVKLLCGVRQGGVLSPYLFAIFIDSVVEKVSASGLGCHIKHVC